MARTKSVSPISKSNQLDQEVDGLLSGRKWTDTVISYSFPTDPTDYEKNYGSEPKKSFGALDAEQSAFVSIFANIAAVTTLEFEPYSGAGAKDATIRLAKSDLSNAEAWAHYPSTTPKGGDAWFDISLAGSFEVGSYNYTLFMHELGHSLGLKHSFEKGSFGAVPHDSLEYTVMSYSSYEGAANWYAAEGDFPQTLMMYDIAAFQYLYGANLDTYDDDTTYQWNPGTGELSIDGDVVVPDAPGNKIFMTIWDAGGEDTYDFSNYTTTTTTGLIVDLRPGGWTTVSQAQLADLDGSLGENVAAGNIANSLAVENDDLIVNLIENVIGAATDDMFIGNEADNQINGGDGADTMTGYAGNDIFVFYFGEAAGDTIMDFDGNGAMAGDSFEFHGFEAGTTFTVVNGHGEIKSDGVVVGTIILANAALVDPLDYTIV